jgi:hypothetical protein
MMIYVDYVANLREQLGVLGKNGILMGSLPPSYDQTISALAASAYISTISSIFYLLYYKLETMLS